MVHCGGRGGLGSAYFDEVFQNMFFFCGLLVYFSNLLKVWSLYSLQPLMSPFQYFYFNRLAWLPRVHFCICIAWCSTSALGGSCGQIP